MSETPDFETPLDITEILWDEITEGDAFALRTTAGAVLAGTIDEVTMPDTTEPHHRFVELDDEVQWRVGEDGVEIRDGEIYEANTGLSIAEGDCVQVLTPSPVSDSSGFRYWAVNRAGMLSGFETGRHADPKQFITPREATLD